MNLEKDPPIEIMVENVQTQKMIASNHSSNVLRTILPIIEARTIARGQGIIFLVDRTQTLGKIALNVEAMKIDLLAAPL